MACGNEADARLEGPAAGVQRAGARVLLLGEAVAYVYLIGRCMCRFSDVVSTQLEAADRVLIWKKKQDRVLVELVLEAETYEALATWRYKTAWVGHRTRHRGRSRSAEEKSIRFSTGATHPLEARAEAKANS